jgi:hypothetical protein
LKIDNCKLKISGGTNLQFAIRNLQFATSADKSATPSHHRRLRLTSLALAVFALSSVCQVGCLNQKHAGPTSALAKRLRPAPIEPGPNGLFMDMIHLERPFGDKELNSDLWASADEEQLEIATRMNLESRGFRVAVLGGPMPPILKTLFSEEELGQMNGEHLQIQSGVPTQLQSSGNHESWPGGASGYEYGKGSDYTNAVGVFRITPRITADGAVDLAMIPEIQHGDARQQYVPSLAGGPLDWSIHVGRQSRLLDDLSFTLRLRSGQYAVLGCLPANRESIGARFFTRSKAGQTIQRVILIKAEPSDEARAARAAKP